MALKKRSTSTTAVGGVGSKAYFWMAADYGNGQKRFHYVTADAPGTVEVSGYFDDDELRSIMKPGDELMVFQVAALDDTRTIQEDFASGFADVSLHYVVQSDGAGINISDDVLGATLTYTS
jgi:hypothetical protein